MPGTTGIPKGVVRDNGGHAVALKWSMTNVFSTGPGEVFWAGSDIGWTVGHGYIVYGPLLHGATTILYEGKPVGTPDAGAYWRVCEQHGVLVLHGPPRHPQYYGQLERQNREHRAWLDAANVVHDDDLDDELERMRTTLNRDWPRRNLGWATPESMWLRRRTPNLDRAELRARVDGRAATLALTMPHRAVRLGTHFRRAIEHELVSLGFLDLQPGGGC